MSTPWKAMRDRLLSEYGAISDLPEVTTTAMTDVDPEGSPVRRGRPIPVKPALRQPLAPTAEPMKRSESWWVTADRRGFTERAEVERQRMAGDVIGRKVPDQIMGKYIGLHRPAE